MSDYILQMKNIDMRFQGVHALDNVSFFLKRGEVHALVGENGAGKSTLMKILIGLYTPGAGEIILRGETVHFKNVLDTRKAGISMIFQEFNHVKHMRVMENIFLGREPKTKLGTIDYKKMYADTKQLLSELEVDINPRALMTSLTVAKLQLVEIVKAISYNSDIIIMDEPTSALSTHEIEHLLKIIRKLRDAQKSIIFISHKMNEIFTICDSVTILRDGKLIHACSIKDITERELIRMMVDREVDELYPKQESSIGDVLLEVKNISCKNAFCDVSFALRKGEILGFAGLMGAGRTELMEALVGLRAIDTGEVYLKGKKIINKTPTDAINRRMVIVPEDRKRNGVILRMNVKNNILLSSLKKSMKWGMLVKCVEEECANKYVSMLQIKLMSLGVQCATLSGGNQQKVAVGRALNADPEIIILDEPTRGIDVKTKAEIHRLMSELACSGKSIIMVSSEIPEIIGMSDRVVVLHEGTITGVLDRENLSPESIMRLAVGSEGD